MDLLALILHTLLNVREHLPFNLLRSRLIDVLLAGSGLAHRWQTVVGKIPRLDHLTRTVLNLIQQRVQLLLIVRRRSSKNLVDHFLRVPSNVILGILEAVLNLYLGTLANVASAFNLHVIARTHVRWCVPVGGGGLILLYDVRLAVVA